MARPRPKDQRKPPSAAPADLRRNKTPGAAIGAAALASRCGRGRGLVGVAWKFLNCVKRAVVTWQLEALEALALMMVVRSLSRLSESQQAALLRKLEDGEF
jgi:hypothetical protein